MEITNIKELAAISWCPVEKATQLMVAGTLAGTVQLDFGSSATLMIYETNNTGEKKIVGAIETPDKFYKLTWGKHPNAEYGLIAGSMLNGTIGVWNPKIIIDEYEKKQEKEEKESDQEEEEEEKKRIIKKEETKAMIATLEGHDGGEIQALAFNNMEEGILVSGGSDSKLNFYDIRNMNNPTTTDFVTRTPHAGQNIVGVSWNKGFAEVLASCSLEGLCVIWDVANKRHLVTFSSDQQKRKYKCVDWNPKNQTFVALASCDDENPVIEIWNLQVPNQPMKVLKGHDKGIMTLMWCPYDDNLLVSGGKDGRTLLWNPNTGEQLGELPRAGNWVYDVQWSMKTSILSVASYDKNIAIYSLQDATIGSKNEAAYETAPKWLSRPVGAIFGFGGLLVSIDNKEGQASRINMHRVKSDSTLPERASNLFTALKSENHLEYIQEKIAEEKSTIWTLMSLLVDKDNKNDRLFAMLGFDKEEVAKRAADEKLVERASLQANVPEALTSPEITDLLRECVITANWSSAVDLCFKCSMFADALIFARKGSQELYEATQDRYLATQGNPVIAMVKSISSSLMDFVDNSELSDWKSTLAILCTYAKGDFVSLCERLGRRLEEAKHNLEASMCYMCADCYGNVLNIWVKDYLERLHDATNRISPDEAAFPLLEKFLIYQKTVKQKFSVTGSLKSAFIMLTVDLTTQGHFEDALWLASLVEDTDINMLKHRLYHSVNKLETSLTQEKPSTPWGKQPRTDFAKATPPSQATITSTQQRVKRLNSNAYINNSNKQYMTSTPSGAVANFGISSNLVNPSLAASSQPPQQPHQQLPTPPQQQPFVPPHSQPPQQPPMPYPPNPNFSQPLQHHQPPPPPSSSSSQPPQQFVQPFSQPPPQQQQLGVETRRKQPSGQPLISGQPSPIVPPMSNSTPQTTSPSSTTSSTTRRRVSSKKKSIGDLDFSTLERSEDQELCQTLLDIIKATYGDGKTLSKSDGRRYDYASKSLVAIYDQLVMNAISDEVKQLLQQLIEMMKAKDFQNFANVHRELTSNHNNESKDWTKGLKFLKQSLH